MNYLYLCTLADVPREKVSDDTPIELSVHAAAQWTLPKPCFSNDLQPPLDANHCFHLYTGTSKGLGCNEDIVRYESRGSSEESIDEGWLSQVEITTHSGPHRKLWMGPQFTFKVFSSPGYFVR